MRTDIFMIIFLFLGAVSSLVVSAKENIPYEKALEAFEFSARIPVEISLPTVIEVPVPVQNFRKKEFVIFEETTKEFQPAIFGERVKKPSVSIAVSASPAGTGDARALSDGQESFVEFPVLLDQDKNSVSLDVTTSQPLVASGFFLDLEPFVALPNTVEVHAIDGEKERVILAKSAVSGPSLRFPKTTSSHYRLRFEYSQPLRVREVSFFNEESPQIDGGYIRFLARPGERYSMYFGADRVTHAPTGEQSDLFDNRDVKKMENIVILEKNPLFVPADTDGDGVRDMLDNCVSEANTEQRDENGNGRGDACDDYDKDEVINGKDNCPSHPNRNQLDADGDGKGDACDKEESRITESKPWLPWASIGLGTAVIVGLFLAAYRSRHDA